MAYEVLMPYHLHMPSYFLGTFTEYPCVIYFPVMFSLFILSMYAVIGVVLLFIIKFALSVMEENSRK